MENTINQNNTIKINRETINKVSNKHINMKPNNEKSILKSMLTKFFFQIFLCIILISSATIYKYIDKQGFKYILNKYEWIFKYNMTYIDTYNYCAEFLNNKLSFNIPLKEKEVLQEINNETNSTTNEEITENIVINQENEYNIENELNDLNEPTVEVSIPYNNMEIMANELKNKYTWVIPTKGTISSKFGNRDASRQDVSTFHLGLDIANDIGTEVYAATSGKVIVSGYNETYGKYLKISKDDVIIIYAHCSKLLVKENEEVKEGDKIALMGNTGIATGPHLHFEVRKNNNVINPEYILNFR